MWMFRDLFMFDTKRPESTESSVGLIPIGVLLCLSVAVRFAANHLYPLDYLEIPILWDPWPLPYDSTSPPLHSILLKIWILILGDLGLGLDQHWLRFPNIALQIWLIISLIRIGRTLQAPWAGLWSAFLLSFLLAPLATGTLQEHYLLEMVFTTWFLERWVRYVVAREAVFRSLAVSALLAMWSGYMTTLIVGPGLVWFLIEAIRRGQIRSGLLTLLGVTLGLAPILTSTIEQAMLFLTISNAPSIPDSAKDMAGQVWGHPVEVSRDSFFQALHNGVRGLFQIHSAWLVVFGLLLIYLIRIPVFYGMLIMVVVFFLGDAYLLTSIRNHTAIWPILVLLPLWSLERILLRSRRPGRLLQVVGVALLMVTNWIQPVHLPSGFLPGGDIREISATIEASPAPDRRVVLFDDNFKTGKVFSYALCRTEESWWDFLDCIGYLRNKGRAGIFRVATAQVIVVDHRPNGRTNLDDVPVADYWRSDGFFLVFNDAFRNADEYPVLPDGCEPVTQSTRDRSSVGYHLFWCDS